MFEQVPGQTQMVWKMTNVADTMQRFCCEWQTEHTPWSVTSDGMQSSIFERVDFPFRVTSGLDKTSDCASLQAWMLQKQESELCATYLSGLHHCHVVIRAIFKVNHTLTGWVGPGAKLWCAIVDVILATRPPVPVLSRWLTCGDTARFVMTGS